MCPPDSLPETLPLNLHSVSAMEDLYRQDPGSVGAEWRAFFRGFDIGAAAFVDAPVKSRDVCESCLQTEFRVLNLIEGYRTRGHFFTRTNPVRARRRFEPNLAIENFGLSEGDLDLTFEAGQVLGLGRTTLREIVAHLEATYCRSVGAQFMYIRRVEQVDWLKHRMEPVRNRTEFSREERLVFFREIAEAVLFEQHIARAFLGQKSFSLEGCEAMVVALRELMRHGAQHGVRDLRLGMAHRGRLNVLARIAGKPVATIFAEFLGRVVPETSHAGDVKYHKGYENVVEVLPGRSMEVGIAPNPSHLEAVAPVVQGMTRARLFWQHGGDVNTILPVVVHGDAAMAGQGVVYETIQMSGLPGYSTGGTIHFVINNQIGFTTNFIDTRSSIYCTDVAKVTLSPVFHVNADDVEAVAHTVRMAVEYRQRYHQDVFIDLLGYRRHGHNETDEPKYTQPLLYKTLEKHLSVLEVYRRSLLAVEGQAIADELERVVAEVKGSLEQATAEAKSQPIETAEHFSHPGVELVPPTAELFSRSPDTASSVEDFDAVVSLLTLLPADLPVFNKIRKVFGERRKNLCDRRVTDWATAELLAFGTLLREGVSVRMSGQDVERGTFSQRHAVVMREDTEERHVPLAAAARDGASFQIFNSYLSEFGVLGFEMGYSMERPLGLTLWEAQFGDFVNGAQTVIDNFLSCARGRWHRMSGLVLLLPHGYEGQGAEHSSARLERWLQLCANCNMQVVYPSTPASHFHALRRQVRWPWRVPLVVMTPKSLLRHPACVSSVNDLTQGKFEEVLDDTSVDPAAVRRVIVCSGKVFYDLDEARRQSNSQDAALVRLEQLYPFPDRRLKEVLDRYPGAIRVFAQEEPANMGARAFVRDQLSGDWIFVSRPASETPATGLFEIHKQEQAEIVRQAFEMI